MQGRPKPTPYIIDRARALRRKGYSNREIAKKLGWSKTSIHRYTRDITDTALAKRVRHLRAFGFDVPPSKQADWDTMGKAGISAARRKVLLRLE